MTSNVVKTHLDNNDEIDVVKLVTTLWQGKAWIFTFSLIFSLAGITYSLKAQQWWTSSAVITNGQYQDTSSIRKELTNLYVVLDSNYKNDNRMRINHIFSADILLASFITEFNAYNNKKLFINSNSIMIDYAKNAKINLSNNSVFFDTWNKKISARVLNQKDKGIYRLEFQGKTASESYELLKAYISFTNKRVRDELLTGLNSEISDKKQMLTVQLISLQNRAEQKRAIEAQKTKYSLDIAKVAKIEQPLAQMNNSNLFSIDLGIKGLSEQEKILQTTKDLSLFEPNIRLVSFELKLLDEINISDNLDIKSIRFLQSPNLPVLKDAPNRTRIVVLAFLLGTMMGIGSVLLRSIYFKFFK